MVFVTYTAISTTIYSLVFSLNAETSYFICFYCIKNRSYFEYLYSAQCLSSFYCHSHHRQHWHLLCDIACSEHFLISLHCILIYFTPFVVVVHDVITICDLQFTTLSLISRSHAKHNYGKKRNKHKTSNWFCLRILRLSTTDYQPRATPIAGTQCRLLRWEIFRKYLCHCHLVANINCNIYYFLLLQHLLSVDNFVVSVVVVDCSITNSRQYINILAVCSNASKFAS